MNPRDMDVLNILFSSPEPMTVTQITCKNLELTQSTVTAVLRKLLNAGFVEVVGTSHSGKVLSRTYSPTELARKSLIEYLIGEYDRLKNVVSVDEICLRLKEQYKD